MNWIRSSVCGAGECVEVAYVKSSKCDTNSCVEVGRHEDHVHVRDSKDPDGPRLTFTLDEWNAFILGAQAGEFNT